MTRTYAALAKQLTNIQKYPMLRFRTIPVTFHAMPSDTAGSPEASVSLMSAQAAMIEESTYVNKRQRTSSDDAKSEQEIEARAYHAQR